MNTAKQVSIMLANNIVSVAQYLLPNGMKNGNEWCVGSVSGEKGDSLRVHLNGMKAGIFCDFATGETGDALTLWSLVCNLPIKDAIANALGFLGMEAPSISRAAKAYQKPPSLNLGFVGKSPVADYLTNERKLSPKTLALFKISERGNVILFPCYRNGELLLVKELSLERKNGKKQARASCENCEPILFGWLAISPESRTLIITEGEIDAMSLFQYGHPAVSIPFGSSNDKWIEADYDHLSIFDEIFLCMDNDKAGQKAAKLFAAKLGLSRCRLVKLPRDDANQCLMDGVTKEEIDNCFLSAGHFDPMEISKSNPFIDDLIEKFYPTKEDRGYVSLLEKTKNKILFRPGDLSVWCGINGHGKSQFIGQLLLDFLKQNARVCIASMEMRPVNLLMRLTKQASGMALPSPEYIRAIDKWFNDGLWLFNVVGTAKADRLLTVFLYMKERYGIDIFIIDSLLKCGLGEDDYNGQKLFIEKLCDFKNTHNVHIHLITHPKKYDDEMTPPNKMSIRGAGAITDLADNVFSLWRNKLKEAKIDKFTRQNIIITDELNDEYDALLKCDKQRNGDWESGLVFWYDKASSQFLNSKTQKPRQYVHYSNLEAVK